MIMKEADLGMESRQRALRNWQSSLCTPPPPPPPPPSFSYLPTSQTSTRGFEKQCTSTTSFVKFLSLWDIKLYHTTFVVCSGVKVIFVDLTGLGQYIFVSLPMYIMIQISFFVWYISIFLFSIAGSGKSPIRLTLRCWGNSSIPEGRFSKWF